MRGDIVGYRSLKSVFHEKDHRAALEEWRQRFHSPGTFHWDFKVGKHPLFVVPTPEVLSSCAALAAQEEFLQCQWQSLDEAGKAALVNALVLAEVRATSAIEGIKHGPVVLEQTLAGLLRGETPTARSHSAGLLSAYLQLGEARLPTTPAELRELYDAAITGDVAPQDLPDGQLFRTGPVYIFNDRGREEHRGLSPETSIHAGLESMLAILAQELENPLIFHLVGHFVLEYIHPFYDGNGRLGRLVLSQGIARALSVPTALCLSSAIYESRGKYYRAFKELQDPRSLGEATPFVLTFLEFLHRAQQIYAARLAEAFH